MEKVVEDAPFQWWWEHTKSEKAARLIERYWNPSDDGSRALKIFDLGPNPKNQTRALKKPLYRMGYRMFWRVVGADIIAWVSPRVDVPNPVKPPKTQKHKALTVDNRTEHR